MLRKVGLCFLVSSFLFNFGILSCFSSNNEIYLIKVKRSSSPKLGVKKNQNSIYGLSNHKISLDNIEKEYYSVEKENQKKMKIIGIIGGITWHSTAEYYRKINELIGERLGGYHSGHIIIYSVNFDQIKRAQYEGRWKDVAIMLTEAAIALKKAGADFIIISAVTIHKVAHDIEEGSGLHILHIADVTGEAIKSRGLRKVALLGTGFTMKEDFISGRLKNKFDLEVIVPEKEDLEIVNHIVFDELAKGEIKESSRHKFIEIINRLVERGAEGIILGCTEIPMLIRPGDVDAPLFDTVQLHVKAAVDFALSEITKD